MLIIPCYCRNFNLYCKGGNTVDGQIALLIDTSVKLEFSPLFVTHFPTVSFQLEGIGGCLLQQADYVVVVSGSQSQSQS